MNAASKFSLPEPDLLANCLAARMRTFKTVQWVKQTSSTNTELLTQGRQDPSSLSWPRLLGTHHQTQGKGRLGRSWLDMPGQSLMFSCGFMLPSKAAASLTSLGPALGISSLTVLRNFLTSDEHLRVKWPNDLMLQDGKVAGLLVEASTKGDRLLLVMGMGLNLWGQAHLSTTLGRDVADIGRSLRSDALAQDLVCELAMAWQSTLQVIQEQGFAAYHRAFTEHDYLAGRDVWVSQPARAPIKGCAQGLSPDGRLMVMTDSQLRGFDVADVSVRLTMPPTTESATSTQ